MNRTRELLWSEWTKLCALRSTYLTLAAAAVLTVAVGAIEADATVGYWSRMPPLQRAHLDPLEVAMKGISVSSLVIAMLGVMAVTAEYGTGSIRTTLTAVPHRAALLLAKAGVLAVVALVTGEIVALVSFFVARAVLGPAHGAVSINAPGVLPAILGAGFYLMIVGLVGVGLGAILRHTAGALGAVVTVLLLIPNIVYVLSDPWAQWFGRAMVSNAGLELTSLHHAPGRLLSPTGSLLLCVGYAIAALAGGLVVIGRRDA